MILRLMLATTSLLVASGARAEWHEASSQHFVVYSDDTAEHVKDFTTRLEKFDKAVRLLRGVPDSRRGPAARVTVYVLDDIGEVQRLKSGGGNVAGFYIPRATGSTAYVPRRINGGSTGISAQAVLLHEYAHHFMFNDWPSAIFPKWFVEGFAEFHATAKFGDDGSVTFGAPPLYRTYGVAGMNTMPMQKLLKPDPGKLSDAETYVLYSRGWLLTDYLTFDPLRRKQLADYITAINDGKSVEDATKVFGNLNALDIKLTSYVKRPTFPSITIPGDQLTIAPVTVRAVSTGEAATMPMRIRSNAGVDDKAAQQVVVQARRAAQPYPADPAAQNTLAEAEYDVKNYAQAAAAADRALAADPKSMHATLYKGMALQAAAEADKTTDSKQWQAIRRYYIAGNKIDSEDPAPLMLYYKSFAANGQTAPKSAESGLLYASALAPFDLTLRLLAARIYLRDGKVPEARAAMTPVAYNPHGGKNAEQIRATLDILNRDGAAAALADLSKKTIEDEKDDD